MPAVDDGVFVGAVIVDAADNGISRGYSRETDPRVHAEEAALAKLGTIDKARLKGSTIYSTLELCSEGRSRRAHAPSSSSKRGFPAWS
ncbi:hypothetical protein [Microbispora rosea]|uniref:hypothetical protein n=1 Tax=Microbispora rosea TaxID=58117 RepID=UPI0039C634D2